MGREFRYYQHQESNISKSIHQLCLNDNKDNFINGSISLLKSEQKILQHIILSMYTSLNAFISLPVIDFECNESQLLPQDNDHDSNASSDEDTSTDCSSDEENEY